MAMESSRVVGTGLDDLLQGSFGADVLLGAAGDDVLRGFEGDDVLAGGVGNDVLDGGRGADTLGGGHGADLFVFATQGELLVSLPAPGVTEAFVLLDWGHDVVTDFQRGVDHLRLGAEVMPVATAAELAQLFQLVEQDVTGDGTLDTVIRLDYVDPASGVHYTDPGSSITLVGVSGATLAELLG